MTKVAKLLIIDPQDRYLMMYRSDHPEYGNDPDLPGGTLENDETILQALLREVHEEAGILIDIDDTQHLYSGTDYAGGDIHLSLYVSKLNHTPDIIVSWEHSHHEWLDKESFLAASRGAIDAYMHMVHDTIKDAVL